MKVEFYKHTLGKEETESVTKCLSGLFLTTGEYVRTFEREFVNYFGSPHWCVGLNSCTAALHLALLALDIGRGDEVITTPMTFIATATAIMHTGAKPVFVDVEPETGLIDCDEVERAISPATKAILPVHLYGNMCDMRRMAKIAEKHGLRLVEDSAHCIEGVRDGVRPGQLSDAACFSFYATKNITSGEGGAVVTRDVKLADRIRLLRQHGMSKEAADRYSGNYRHWDMLDCGWKYNMDNIHASILLPQLAKIDSLWREREHLHKRYVGALSDVPGIRLPKIPAASRSAYHLFTVLVDGVERDTVLAELSLQNIGVAVNYRAIHLLTYLRETLNHRSGDFPVAENIGEKTVSLPFWVGMKGKDIEFVVSALNEIMTKAEKK